MPETLQLSIRPTIFSKQRLLTIEPEFITLKHEVATGNRKELKFNKENIAAMRYGIKGIRGYRFNIGRIYCIDVKDDKGAVISIRLKTLYRINNAQLGNKYKAILKVLWLNFMTDIANAYVRKFLAKEDFTLVGVAFTQDGLQLDAKMQLLPWFDLGTKNYVTSYTIFSTLNPHKNRNFNYLDDWNTALLYSVSRGILVQKNLWKEKK